MLENQALTRIYNPTMRPFLALLLLLCVGILMPAVGGPASYCFMDAVPAPLDCGCDCDKEVEGEMPCCMQLDELPDAQAPEPLAFTPEVSVTDLEWLPFTVSHRFNATSDYVDHSVRNRAPTSSHRRALLAIWRL